MQIKLKRILKMMPPKQAEKAMRGYPCRAMVRSENVSARDKEHVRVAPLDR